MFAVVSLNTTGLHPSTGHRISGIGIHLLDSRGHLQTAFGTTVNPSLPPRRHALRTQGHEHVGAPKFADIAGHVVGLLTDRILVSHNVRHTMTFLGAEYRNLGVAVPLTTQTSVCTMTCAGERWPTARRDLTSCAQAAGLARYSVADPLGVAHTTASLLRVLLHHRVAVLEPGAARASTDREWPSVPSRPLIPITVPTPTRATATNPVRRIWVNRVPALPGPAAAQSYYALLDDALVSTRLSRRDAESLRAAASSFALTAHQQHHLHRTYFAALVAAARSDRIITLDGFLDLHATARFLGVPAPATRDLAYDGVAVRTPTHAALLLPAGARLAFADEHGFEVGHWKDAAIAAGFQVVPISDGCVDMLICCDPHADSTAHRAARERSIPMATVGQFTRALHLV